MRLDLAVVARFPEISRRKARELIAQRRVLVNDRPLAVASREISEKDRVTIAAEIPELVILRETPDWVAVDKPAGLPTQPPRDRKQRSLEELLRIRYRDIHLVHRIDRETSGVVLFARGPKSAAELSALFSSRAIRKSYLAVFEGVLDREVTIDVAIEGRSAISVVHPLSNDGASTRAEIEILTGRTHQIRIHLASIGHPVAGDSRYGATAPAPRLMLHAWKLAHPSLGDDLVAPAPF